MGKVTKRQKSYKNDGKNIEKFNKNVKIGTTKVFFFMVDGKTTQGLMISLFDIARFYRQSHKVLHMINIFFF